MHSFYVANSKTEVKYAYKEFDDKNFEVIVKKTIFSFNNNEKDNNNSDDNDDFNEEDFNEEDFGEEDFNEEETEKDDEVAIQINEIKLSIENLVNLNDPKFLQALEMKVFILILPHSEIAEVNEHGNPEYDIHSIVKSAILKRVK